MKTYIYMYIYENVCFWILIVNRNVSYEVLYRKSKHTNYIRNFFQKIVTFCDNVGKFISSRQATEDNMLNALFMLGNKSRIHSHTHTI